MDSGRAPLRVFLAHSLDEIAQATIDLRASYPLSPEIADLFEREANNFARFVLFKGDKFATMAADCPFEIKTPMKLAKKFGASVYASVREFARTNHRPCLVYVLEPIEFCERTGAKAEVRRIEPSPSFERQFGRPADTRQFLLRSSMLTSQRRAAAITLQST